MALEQGAFEIALVVDAAQRLVGTMTDGDVRRALLRGATLGAGVAEHMHRDFTAVAARANRAEVLDLMQARSISQVPVLDADGRLVGLHLLRDVIGVVERPNWAVIMVGGRGSRLAPLTDEIPKPMLKVAGRPILERIVLHLVGHGIRRIFLAINYLGNVIESHFGNGERFGARIDYLREQRPLGTGGALSIIPETPTAPLLVMNGDLVTQADVGALIAFHESGPQTASVAVRKYFHTVPFGCVEVEGDRLVGLEEKPTLTRLVNAGIYVINPSLVTALPRHQAAGLPEIISGAMNRNEVVRVFEIDEDWIDVGQREQLRQARGEG
jgi:dTDP-glucose pyrophosphorylase